VVLFGNGASVIYSLS